MQEKSNCIKDSVYIDDGYTGTNFERPGVQNLLKQVKEGKTDCILVKDFSRFARDYIELGSYLEQIFPFMGVRFISVNDHYDSETYQGGIAGIDVNFKNLLYDLYSKDLSGKVRSSLAVKKQQGQYVSANSPFGYEKDPDDRHRLVIAPDEAEIVRKIFSLAMDGLTSVEIAKLLNREKVKTPIAFKMEKGKTSRKPKGERFLWSAGSICQILKNEIYIGSIAQKKYTKDFVGGKNHLNPRSEWVTSENHHEPIIDRKLFDRVQEMRRGRQTLVCHSSHLSYPCPPSQARKSHPLTGKAVCGCCKRNLCYRRSRNPYFTCRSRYSGEMEACVDKVNAMFLEQYVLFMIQDKMKESECPANNLEEMADKYIEKIVIYDEKHLEVSWKEEIF